MQSPRIVIMRGEFYLFQYRDLDIVGICGLTQEKLVKEGFDFWVLTFGKHAMGMTAKNGVTHAVFYAKLLPDLTSGLCRNKCRTVSQPFVVGIAQNE